MKFPFELPNLSKIPKADRIPFGQKIAFGLGQTTEYFGSTILTSLLWLPFFNLGLGISPIVLGVVLMIIRAWDAISDPLVGNISDNIRTRWGRRRPLIFVAAITTALLFPLLWHFPASVVDGSSVLARIADWFPFIGRLDLTASEKAGSLYLLLIGLAYFTSFTCWSMPFYGLQLELTPNYDERTRLTVIMALIGKVATFVTSWTFVAIVFIGAVAQGDLSSIEGKPAWIRELIAWIQPWLGGVAGDFGDEKPIVTGTKLFSWAVAALIVCLGILPAIFVKERYYAKETSKQARDPFWKSVRESFRCGPLWSLILISFFLVMGYASIGGLGTYVNIYYVCDGDMLKAGTIAGLKGSILAISGILLLPLYTWLGERFDKRAAVLLMLATSVFGHLLNYFLMTPEYPYLQIVSGFFEASSIGAVWLFLPSMKADVADWDESKTHRRREGSINAFYSWFIKLSLTLSMGISGAVLALTGYNAKADVQPEAVVDRMFYVYLAIPAVLWIIAFVSAWFYPLSRERARLVRAELEARRGFI